MAKTVTFVGTKGGTMKTACSLSVATVLALQGKRVALVDCDPQGSSTRSSATMEDNGEGGSRPVRTGRVSDALSAPPHIVPLAPIEAAGGELLLYRASMSLASATTEEIKKHVDRAKLGVDYVVVDTMPVMGAPTFGTIMAADLVVVPTDTSHDSREQLPDTLEVVRQVRPDVLVRVVLTKADGRERITREAISELQTDFADEVYSVSIPVSAAAKNAGAEFAPSVLVCAGEKVADAYYALGALIARDLARTRS
jgi:chromosome partitioning protein